VEVEGVREGRVWWGVWGGGGGGDGGRGGYGGASDIGLTHVPANVEPCAWDGLG